MLKKIIFLFLALVWGAGDVAAAQPTVSIQDIMANYQDEILKINREEELKTFFTSHLLGNYGDIANVVGFTDALTAGVYLKEVNYLLKEKILETHIDALSLKSVDKIRAHLTRIKQAQPLTTNINADMTKIGYYVTAATLATQAYRAFLGDEAAKREAIATSVSAEIGWIVNKIGSTSLSVSMAGVQFIDYALRKFITAQYDQYNDFWWNAYAAYYNQKYPSLVTGSSSWAALIATADPQAVERRLDEFWQDPLENAAIYYKTPSPFQRDALAMAQFRQPFAGSYYNTYLKPTLETYFGRQAEAEYTARRQDAEKSYKELVVFIEEMRVLKKVIEEVRLAKPLLPKVEIFRVTLGDYQGKAFVPPAQNGDDLHFSARIVFPEGIPAKGIISWRVEAEDGREITQPTHREISEAGVTKGYGYRPHLRTIDEGRYRVILRYHLQGDPDDYVEAIYPLEFQKQVKITKIIATDHKEDPTPKAVLPADGDLYFFVYYIMNKGVTTARMTFHIKNLSTGAVAMTLHADAVAVSEGNEAYQYIADMAVPPGLFQGGEKGALEAIIATPDGRMDSMVEEFVLVRHELVLHAPRRLKSGQTAEFSIQVPPDFKPPYTVYVQPTGGLNAGHRPGSLRGTVGAISAQAATGRLSVTVLDAENKKAAASRTIDIVATPQAAPRRPAPSQASLSGSWGIRTANSRGTTTEYSMSLQGAGNRYSGTIRRLGPQPYSWPADVSYNPTTGEIYYAITLGTKPPFIQLVHTGKVASGGRSASGTYRRQGGTGTAWSGTWSAVKH
jgi:hypothetical protein